MEGPATGPGAISARASGKDGSVRGAAWRGFFFSSRRRHTRCSRDWSSDVCSSDLFCAEAGSAEQSATADGSEHSVEVWYFFEKLFGGCGLAGDDAVVVIRMNQIGASLLLHTVTDFLARGNLGLTKGDFAAVDLDSLDFHSRRVFRHDDISGHAAPGCRTGHRRTVIAARLRNDAAGGLLRGKRQNGVGGATNLEGAGLLQVLAFEEETGSGQCVE